MQIHIGFEVFRTVVMKSTIFWDITLFIVVRWKSIYVSEEDTAFIFYPEDGSDILLRNVDRLLANYMALYHRR
jgi:hypothetical protein